MRKIAVFGGSFNPPHCGHFETAEHMLKVLGVDEVWFLFSLNPSKDPNAYAPLHHRLEMGRIMAGQYPDCRFIMSDIEEEIGSHITLDVMKGLKARFPADEFIWTMSADNLAGFHTWDSYDEFIETFPIAVLDRKGYTDAALSSIVAKTYPHLRVSDPKDLAASGKGWCFLDNPAREMASRNLLTDLRNGVRVFDENFQKIADYIVLHGLFGLNATLPAPTPACRPPVPLP